MENDLYKDYAEVDKILSFMGFRYVEKVPKKMRDMFKNEKLQGYEPNIDKNIPLEEQKLERKTIAILAMLNLNYWCENEEEKQELIRAYSNNDKKRNEEIREIYIECVKRAGEQEKEMIIDIFKRLKAKKRIKDIDMDEIIESVK